MSEELPELITVANAAKYLGITVSTIYLAIRKKKIIPVKHGNLWYLNFNEIKDFNRIKYIREENRIAHGEKVFDKAKNRYSTKQVAEMFNVPVGRVYHCLRANKIKYFQVGSTYVIPIEDMEAFRKIIVPFDPLSLNLKRL